MLTKSLMSITVACLMAVSGCATNQGQIQQEQAGMVIAVFL